MTTIYDHPIYMRAEQVMNRLVSKSINARVRRQPSYVEYLDLRKSVRTALFHVWLTENLPSARSLGELVNGGSQEHVYHVQPLESIKDTDGVWTVECGCGTFTLPADGIAPGSYEDTVAYYVRPQDGADVHYSEWLRQRGIYA